MDKFFETLESRRLFSAAVSTVVKADKVAVAEANTAVKAAVVAQKNVSKAALAEFYQGTGADDLSAIADAKQTLKDDIAAGEDSDTRRYDAEYIAEAQAQLHSDLLDVQDQIALDAAAALNTLEHAKNQLAFANSKLKLDLKGKGTTTTVADLTAILDASNSLSDHKLALATTVLNLQSEFRTGTMQSDLDEIENAKSILKDDSDPEFDPDPETLADDRAAIAEAVAQLGSDQAQLAADVKAAQAEAKGGLDADAAAIKAANAKMTVDLKATVSGVNAN